MKFLADMGISPASVRFLRSLGYDAVRLYEEGLYQIVSVTERRIRLRLLPI